MTTNPFRYAAYAGLVMMIFASIIMVISPPPSKEDGAHSSQIVAFEFVDNKMELGNFFIQLCEGETKGMTPEEHCKSRKKSIDLVNYLDFGMMIFYGLFLFLFTETLGQINGLDFLGRAKYLAPLAVIFDVLENSQMLIMTRSTFDFSEHIFMCLSLFTRIKWGLLAALIAIIGYGMKDMPKSKWLGYVLMIPIVAYLYSIITDSYAPIEIMTGSILLSFFLVLLYSFIYRDSKSAVD